MDLPALQQGGRGRGTLHYCLVFLFLCVLAFACGDATTRVTYLTNSPCTVVGVPVAWLGCGIFCL